jgi:hypothetical protein
MKKKMILSRQVKRRRALNEIKPRDIALGVF